MSKLTPAPFIAIIVKCAKQFLNRFGLITAYWLCRVLPIAWVSGFGAWRGRYRGANGKALEARARHNLTIICPHQPVDPIVTELKRAAGRAALETFIADRIVKQGHVHWHGCEAVDQAMTRQQSVVFVLAHLDNLGDVIGAAINKRFSGAREHAVLTRQIKEPILARLIRRTRMLSLGSSSGWIEPPSTGIAKRALKTLQNRPSTLVLHVDEARQHQVHVPRFGRGLAAKGTNIHYAVRFAKRSNACLVALSMHRNPEHPTHFNVRPLFIEDMSIPANQAGDDDLTILAIDDTLTAHIKSYPASWLQLYHLRLGGD